MELKEFVSETLNQIVEGVKEAQESVKPKGAKINPHMQMSDAAGKQGLLRSTALDDVQIIEFDVAITITEGKGGKGGIGVFAGAIGIGARGEITSENTSVSRIKFKIPVALPA